MEVRNGPNALDEPNLCYKLQRKIKIFSCNDNLPNRGYNLVTCSSKYGIVFIALPDGSLSVYYLKELIDKECSPQHLSVKLQEKPTHTAVSCDQELLAVTGGQLLLIYKVIDFQNANVSPIISLRCEVNPTTFVSALQWNPCIPDTIALAYHDGTLLASQVSTQQIKKIQSKARCICWSPKGKQLVVGNNDGTLCQYKPDLSPMKMIPAPNLFEGAPVEALAIYWISTFQFAVVYKNASDNSRPAVTIVNTPKGGQPSCMNYEDICYSMGSNRPWYCYLLGIAQWNIIMTSSSNSMEIATLGSMDGANWLQWCQSDEARPELPLTDKRVENFPIGLCIDICAIHQLPWGENQTLNYMPLLHVVSQTGLLTIFNVINLNNQAPQVCIPPQPLTLPAAALTSQISSEAPPQPPALKAVTPPSVPPPIQLKPQGQMPASTGLFGSLPNTSPTPAFSVSPQSALPAFTPAPASQITQIKQPNEPKAAPAPVKQTVLPAPKPAQSELPGKTPTQAPEVTAAIKAEQERVNKLKLEQELKHMLINEINDFQSEHYDFLVHSRKMAAEIQRDLDAMEGIEDLQSMDAETLKRECSLDDLRAAIIQLKLDLVRTCAVVAEARTHAESKDIQEWTQSDPLTCKRIVSIKKLSYYIQTQLSQAEKSLEYQWKEIASRENQYNKPSQRMIRPILDDVYQPLVKQQEILSRQQAVLKTLRKTLNEVDLPILHKTSLLRSTPFRNKDPLSKLTKNILNLSIEPKNKDNNYLLTPQKLDALRDLLANHKPNKIKPTSIELTNHIAAMRLKYQKTLKERAEQKVVQVKVPEEKPSVKIEPKVEAIVPTFGEPVQFQQQPVQNFTQPEKVEVIPDAVKPVIKVPSFTPVSGTKPPAPSIANVARTLFTNEAKEDVIKPTSQNVSVGSLGMSVPKSSFTFSALPSSETHSVLKSILQEKPTNETEKSDNNTFMGQKICSPSASIVAPPSTLAQTSGFMAKTIVDYNSMFNKFAPQAFTTDKPQVNVTVAKPESMAKSKEIAKPIDNKQKENKPLTNLFGMATSTPSANSATNVPDVLKSNVSFSFGKPATETTEKAIAEDKKENVPLPSDKVVVTTKENNEKPKANVSGLKSTDEDKLKLGSDQSKTPISLSDPVSLTDVSLKSNEEKPKITVENLSPKTSKTTTSPLASSLFAAANATISLSQSPGQTPSPSAVASDVKPSSIFAAAAAKTSQSGSIFAANSTTTSPSSLFGNNQGSLFGSGDLTENKTSIFGTSSSSPASVFGQASSMFPDTSAAPAQASVTTSASIFRSQSQTVSDSIFSSSKPSTESIFTGTTTTTTSVFGTNTSTTQSSVIESQKPASDTATFVTTAPATPASVFSTTSPTSQSSLFGNSSSASVFGAQTTTTSTSVFGSITTSESSVFGSKPTTPSSIFGSTTPTSQPASVFAAAAVTTQTTTFGTANTQPLIFATTTASAQASIFGSSTQTTQASLFKTQTSQSSVFEATPTTTQSSSLFGGAEANLFASASISTTTAPSQTSGGSLFGGGASSSSVFGGSASPTNVFGSKQTFGETNPQAAAIFGGAASMGQKPANNLWGSEAQSGSGSFGSGFGQSGANQWSSSFGNWSGGSFSTPQQQGSAFGSSQQTSAFGATGDTKPSVFGSPQQQAAPGFGGSPVFGSKPAFGQSAGFGTPPATGAPSASYGSFGGFNKSPSAGFGGPATFGSGSTFGGSAFGSSSPSKAFGAAAPAPSFGAQSNATFESLASQNTLTFGNLAQQSGQPQAQSTPFFNTSPSFTGWRG